MSTNLLEGHGFLFHNWQGSEELSEQLGISNAVIVPANARRVIVGGQLGLRDNDSVPSDVEEQIELAFTRVTRSLQACGLGDDAWQYVYSVRSFPSVNE